MISLRNVAIAAAMAIFCVTGYAKTPVEHDAHHPDAASTGNMSMPMVGPDAKMARMDEQMKTMQLMHDKMMKAKTPKERSALMAEHMKVMQDGMAMMGEMAPDSMMGKGGMGAMGAKKGEMPDSDDSKSMGGDTAMHHQMMEKRMQMMQSMMQMMMDRMAATPGKS